MRECTKSKDSLILLELIRFFTDKNDVMYCTSRSTCFSVAGVDTVFFQRFFFYMSTTLAVLVNRSSSITPSDEPKKASVGMYYTYVLIISI